MGGHDKVLFIAGFGPISDDMDATRKLYEQDLRLPLTGDNSYMHGEGIKGIKHFAIWPLSQAAQSCFSSDEWPSEYPRPQSWMEFDVADIASITLEFQQKGYDLLVDNYEEPWGQRVTRFLSPEGILLGLTHTPWLRD